MFKTAPIQEKDVMAKAQVVITVGLPGCGKSTYAKKLVEEYGFVQLELDQIREELGGRQDMSLTLQAVALRDQRLAQMIAEGKKVVISDTNTVTEFRRKLVEQVFDLGIKPLEVLVLEFDCNVETAKARNAHREHAVPEYVIDRMAAALAAESVEADYWNYYWKQERRVGPSHLIFSDDN